MQADEFLQIAFARCLTRPTKTWERTGEILLSNLASLEGRAWGCRRNSVVLGGQRGAKHRAPDSSEIKPLV